MSGCAWPHIFLPSSLLLSTLRRSRPSASCGPPAVKARHAPWVTPPRPVDKLRTDPAHAKPSRGFRKNVCFEEIQGREQTHSLRDQALAGWYALQCPLYTAVPLQLMVKSQQRLK